MTNKYILWQKARIHDLEGLLHSAQCKIDELEEQCATMKIQAQAAAMREALERFKWYIENSDGFWMGDKCGAWALDDNQSLEYQVMELLNSDAGRALLERLRKAERKKRGRR